MEQTVRVIKRFFLTTDFANSSFELPCAPKVYTNNETNMQTTSDHIRINRQRTPLSPPKVDKNFTAIIPLDKPVSQK